jgi:hypothetical protein
MPVYKLLKDGEVVNTIVAEPSFFDTPSADWDSYEEVIPPVPAPTPEPEPAEPPPPPDIKVSPIEFKLLFTSPERIAIKAARATNPVVDDFFDIVEDPRLTHVNLSLTSTIMAIGYLEQEGLIAEGRAAEILQGQVQ